jgi:hypothetical protein
MKRTGLTLIALGAATVYAICRRRAVTPTVINGFDYDGDGHADGAAYPLIQSLTPVVFQRRVGDVFPASYMTALAVIQGVALGILLTNTQDQWLRDPRVTNHVMIASQACAVSPW